MVGLRVGSAVGSTVGLNVGVTVGSHAFIVSQVTMTPVLTPGTIVEAPENSVQVPVVGVTGSTGTDHLIDIQAGAELADRAAASHNDDADNAVVDVNKVPCDVPKVRIQFPDEYE